MFGNSSHLLMCFNAFLLCCKNILIILIMNNTVCVCVCVVGVCVSCVVCCVVCLREFLCGVYGVRVV